MIRAFLLALLLLVTPALAQDHDDDHHDDHAEEHHDDHDHDDDGDDHVAEADGIRAVHAWANATTGSIAYVFVEIGNTSETVVTLTGAETAIAQSAELVGFANTGGELAYVPLPEMPIAPGSEVVFAPNGLAIRLTGLTQPLVQGEHFEIELEFSTLHLDAIVEIESATATQHSHAGHSH